MLFMLLEQSEVFRATCICSVLRETGQERRLFVNLDARSVGHTISGRTGRARWLSHDAILLAIGEFLQQARFEHALDLDLSGVYLGDAKPEANHLLQLAARFCPKLQCIRLGAAEPSHIWSDLARHLSPALERSLRSWWEARPLIIEAYNRQYMLDEETTVILNMD